MRLTLTEEQSLIEPSVRDFLAAEYDFARRQRSVQAPHACEPTVWRQFADMGWLGLLVPERAGGLGVGMLEAGLVMRAFGRHLVVEPYAATALLATPLLAAHGRSEQRSDWLPPLIDGSRRAVLAHEEITAPLPWLPRTTVARREGGGWVLRGRKQLVPGACGADLLLVSARVDAPGQGHRIFAVRPGTAGVQVNAAATADGAQAADLTLQDVRLSDADLLGEDVDASTPLAEACAWHLVALCWEAVGAMEALQEQTAAYVLQRVQFGQPLSQFQVVAHRLAEMAVCCVDALASCELAALRLEAGPAEATELASMAKSKVGRESRFVGQQAVQLHGAMGVTEELPVASWFRKLTAFSQQGGSTSAHSREFGLAMLRTGAWAESRTLGTFEPAVELR